jgi:hypothetical protein
MRWFHSKQRNRLKAATNEMQTTIKMHWEAVAPRKISSTQQAKHDKFDQSVASSIADADMSQQLFPTKMPILPAVGLAAQALLQQQHQQLGLQQQLSLQQQMGLQQQFFST